MNNPSLSRNRFGQSVFLKEDEELFKGNATGDDWDMGQELVAYLHGFGTKTYLYLQDEELKCVNGYVQQDNDTYTVYSFAAYPKQYISEDLGLFATCEPNKMMPKIILRRNIAGKFECIKKEEITSS